MTEASGTAAPLRVSGKLGKELRALTPRQFEAVTCTRSAAVIAGPGSGKTRVLVAKAALLLQTEVVEPHKIACITFTRSAADEIRARLQRLVPESSRRFWVGTVHGFCLTAILGPYSRPAGLPAASRAVLPAVDQVSLLQRAFDLAGISEQQATKKVLENVGTRIRRRLATGDPPSEGDDLRFYQAMRQYDSDLEQTGALDFEAMSIRSLQLLRGNPELAKLLCAKFPWVLVDEYQDLGGVLHEIVQELRRAKVHVFAVGDPNQCIMEFAGASPEYFYSLEASDGVDPYTLDRNHRSSRQVVAASLLILGEVPATYYGSADDEGGFTRTIEVAGDLREHARATVEEIRSLSEHDNGSSSMAVLYKQATIYPGGGRRVEIQNALLEALSASGIEFTAERNTSFPRTPLVEFIRDCATWALDRADNEVSGQLLRDLTSSWSRVVGHDGRRDRFALQERLYAALLRADIADLTVREWVVHLDSSLALGRDLKRSGRADDIESLESLRSGEVGLSDVAELAGRVKSASGIALTTYHSAKGREWDYVFLPYVVEGHVPGWYRGAVSDLGENRRAFYVASSRARVGTTILTSNLRTPHYRLHDRSRFLHAFD